MTTARKGDVYIRTQESHPDVFGQVVLYVLDRVGECPNIGETALHKILYLIDFDYFEKFEENLMGETYIKNHYGPTSKNLERTLNQMEADGVIRRFRSVFHGHEQKRCSVLQKPVPIDLIEPYVDHIDGVLAKHAGKTGRELTDYSHGDIPWLCTGNGQHISYESVFYRDEEHSVREYVDEL